ncbi:hypothetical protein BFP97_07500 [Roseivirga sp. 4D4]|uniref:tetratricopeptide repeat protein n=1 Tax=Roseivirga sp. 4D4 TaxID=1889784 RepID=UPI000852E477|nr:hypothetical protein [Roseivirga sp. 4D4]OEK01370.1 hypothetical protein BFP97_07500 [Roseivirga sp. 4D4]
MRVKYIFLFILAITYSSALAQDVTEQEIKNNYAIASDNMDYKKYNEAIPALNWLLKNAPSFSQSVQDWSIQVFETIANETGDKQRKLVLLDSMLIAFESKREYFGLSDLAKNKLAFRYYKYFRNSPEKYEEAYEAFVDVFKKPETVINNNLVPYIYMAKQYDAANKTLSIDQKNKIYDDIQGEVATRKANNGNASRLDNYMSNVDNLYIRLLGDDISCDAMTRLAGGLSRSDSVKVSKRLMSITLDTKCGRTTEYEKALGILARNEPNPGLFKILAQYSAVDKKYKEAISYYQKALALEVDDVKKANIYFDIAQLYYIDMDKPAARKNALASIELDPKGSAKAYSFIGNLYMSSFNECSEGNNPVEDRAVFFVAYEMFEKAKDVAGMEEAQKQFPTKSEAFNHNMIAGDAISVGCWINAKTKVRTRSSN